MVEVCAIASGSNGNCYYVGNQDTAVLIDVGLSRRQLLDRMKKVAIDPGKIKAIFISHEHADHFRGARVLANQINVPVYMTQATYGKTKKADRPHSFVKMNLGDTIKIDDLSIHAFSKQHDAIDPCSFRVETNGKNIGIFTDIGAPCSNVAQHLSQCHLLFLEANYEEQLLWDGPYPYFLKQRVSSDFGHLSNQQSVKLIEEHAGDQLHTIFLSHISADNNRPQLAMEAFEPLSNKYNIQLTNRYAPCEVLKI